MVPAMKPWLTLAGFIALCFGAAGLGGLATGRSVDTWYKDLAKPSWTPPGWVFGPVWTVLDGISDPAVYFRRVNLCAIRSKLLIF